MIVNYLVGGISCSALSRRWVYQTDVTGAGASGMCCQMQMLHRRTVDPHLLSNTGVVLHLLSTSWKIYLMEEALGRPKRVIKLKKNSEFSYDEDSLQFLEHSREISQQQQQWCVDRING